VILPIGIRRLALTWAGVSLVAVATAVMFTGPALAAPRPVTAAQVLRAPSGVVYKTTVKGLHVRKGPHTSAAVVAVLGAAGTKVTVNCYAIGSSVFGDSVWYHLVAPHTGFSAGFYLDTGRDPAPGIPACSRHTFRTLVHGLHVRTGPHTSAAVVAVLGAAGTKVAVNCYAIGGSVFGDSVWYHLVAPHRGFAAGFYLDTGRDPAAGIRRC
jgi:hypothetical protein